MYPGFKQNTLNRAIDYAPFSVIVCTYMRPQPLAKLLGSFASQTLYPDEILIIDGSTNELTREMLAKNPIRNLRYFKVPDHERGLTRQRNFGLDQLSGNSKIVCYLDDDTFLEPDYFLEVLKCFGENPDVVGVGGVAVNENRWTPKVPGRSYNPKHFYEVENHVYKEGARNVLRNYLGLASNQGPGRMPEFSHGRTCGFPLTGKSYDVDLLIGLSFAFRREVFDSIRFSPYFEGYGLYEDADFSIRAQQFGKNKITTAARLDHYHDAAGRPNQYKYGKMVVRNGWYVWRVKYPNPSLNAKFKWHTITVLLMVVRATNIISKNPKPAATEFFGRFAGWLELFVNKPKIDRHGE